jgi:hypothetical protein
VGKTALAIRFAHQVAERFPDGQLYVDLNGFSLGAEPVSPAQAVREFLDALAVAPERIPSDTEARVRLYRSLMAGKRMLIVLDNARDEDQVRALLPGTPGCLVIVTSRNQLTSLAAGNEARLVNLDVLSRPEARGLLAGRLGRDRIAAEPEAADELIELCARLPLALAVAAAVRAAGQPRLPLAAVARELRDARSRLDALDTGDAATSVRSVFSCSYRHLSPQAARMFRLLALHPGPDISIPAAASLAGIPAGPARQALRELTRAHMLTEPAAPGRTPFTICYAPTQPSWLRPPRVSPAAERLCTGCSATTCTPRTPRPCCCTLAASRSAWPARPRLLVESTYSSCALFLALMASLSGVLVCRGAVRGGALSDVAGPVAPGALRPGFGGADVEAEDAGQDGSG